MLAAPIIIAIMLSHIILIALIVGRYVGLVVSFGQVVVGGHVLHVVCVGSLARVLWRRVGSGDEENFELRGMSGGSPSQWWEWTDLGRVGYGGVVPSGF